MALPQEHKLLAESLEEVHLLLHQWDDGLRTTEETFNFIFHRLYQVDIARHLKAMEK
jgi:hypothetical protein